MKYFIDFEASEREHKIISVGCIREDGKEFYSLVYTEDPITPRIEEITGISQEIFDESPDSVEVFESFADWLSDDTGLPEFYCYGDSDPDFVYHNFLSASTMKEAQILSYLYMTLTDYSLKAKEHFYTDKTISLEKLAKHYDDAFTEQNHNALDDAKILKTVYENLENTAKENNVFTEYVTKGRVPGEVRAVLRMNGDEIAEEYPSMKDAVSWIREKQGGKNSSGIEDKIKRAAKDGIRYFGYHWRIL